MAEELYYRGFVQSAGVLAFSPLSTLGVGGVCVREAVPLVLSAALFGLVHTEFVQDAVPAGDSAQQAGVVACADPSVPTEPEVVESKAYWFRVTAAYGAAYSLLYVVTGHRLLAPVCAHAGLNIGLCLRDWARMRMTPALELQRMFESQRD